MVHISLEKYCPALPLVGLLCKSNNGLYLSVVHMLLQKSGFSSGPNQWAAVILYRRLRIFDIILVLLVNPLIILILFLKRTIINKTDMWQMNSLNYSELQIQVF